MKSFKSLFCFLFLISCDIFAASNSGFERYLRCFSLDKNQKMIKRPLFHGFKEVARAFEMGKVGIGPRVYEASLIFFTSEDQDLKFLKLDLTKLEEDLDQIIKKPEEEEKILISALIRQMPSALKAKLEPLSIEEQEQRLSESFFLYPREQQAGYLRLELFQGHPDFPHEEADLVSALDIMKNDFEYSDVYFRNSIWFIIKKLANQLKYLHDRNLVHGDFKNDNVLWEICKRKTRLALTDFETTSCAIMPTDLISPSFRTISYFSPQLFFLFKHILAKILLKDDQKPQPITDETMDLRKEEIWAFGASIYQIATGQLFFEKDYFSDEDENVPCDEREEAEPYYYMDQPKDELIASLKDKIRTKVLDRNLQELLHHMLAYDSKDRYSVDQIIEYCENVISKRNLEDDFWEKARRRK